jgi:hypothetical protein
MKTSDFDLEQVSARLRGERPLPDPHFQDTLRRDLIKLTAERRSVRIALAITTALGGFLLVFAAVGVLGVGPLAA